uniref:Major facilitator superfamily (MFS) profile domain-containing protein n=1 Tax=Phlebotomus papatasi TaxID=29031 RepID=A0A1B0D080_PHLPP
KDKLFAHSFSAGLNEAVHSVTGAASQLKVVRLSLYIRKPKMSREETKWDKVLQELGDFGVFQLKNYILISLVVLLPPVYGFSYVFSAADMNYRCRIDECEPPGSNYSANTTLLELSIPQFDGKFSKCDRFSVLNRSVETCDASNFDHDLSKMSGSWPFVGTMANIGQFIALPITGFFSDRFGRKTAFIISTLCCGLCGIIKSFATSYTMLVIFEFLEMALGSGIYACGYVLGMELVGPSKRAFGTLFINCFYTTGGAILGFVALTQCRSKSGGEALPELKINPVAKKKKKSYPIASIFSSPALLIRLAICSFCWITNTFVYYGLVINSASFGENIHTSFILGCFIEIPSFICSYLVLDRIGRRWTLCSAFLLSGAACLTFIFVGADLTALRLILFLIGRFGITISFTSIYLYTTEIFPTELRSSLLSFCSTVGRIGAAVAPQTPLLAKFSKSMPMILFCGTAIVAGFLILQAPETLNAKLPDTVQQAEKMKNPSTNNIQ